MDRLALIRARHEEAGGGDEDKAWLLAEVERLRNEYKSLVYKLADVLMPKEERKIVLGLHAIGEEGCDCAGCRAAKSEDRP